MKTLCCQAILVVIVVVETFVSGTPFNDASKCGYDSCPKTDPNKLNIHIIAHTHDDVGWLKTVDQYFYGVRNGEQRAGVQYILDSVIQELKDHPQRRFIYVETAFFWKWWKQQTDETREVVKAMVNEGRLEFISGGWSMNDEASVHYNSVIDSMTLGHRRLNDIFGVCSTPRIGWQIDPFGHSREQASLFSQMGFDAVFFGRIDWEDKTLREKEKRMEFIWKSSSDLGRSSDLFTGILPNGYGYPNGFCFDDLCGDKPIIDDVNSEEYNVNQMVEQFIHEMQEYQKRYTTNNIIVTFGTDFTFQNARVDFRNIDLLMKYVNERQASGSNINVFYSTPSCYVKSVHESNKTWTTKTDDFFPYASDPHAFWTGYFTSRPAFKLLERKSNAWLQTCKQLEVLSGINDDDHDNRVNVFKESMGVAQHHDAVSGTSKQHVVDDYALQLNKGLLSCQSLINDAAQTLLPKTSSWKKHSFKELSFCPLLNVSECSTTESNNKIAILVYNPRSQPITDARISLPWNQDSFTLTKSHDNQQIPADLIRVPSAITNIPGRMAKTTHEVVFKTSIPALGFTTLFLERKAKSRNNKLRQKRKLRGDQGFSLKGKDFEALFDKDGRIEGVRLSSGGTVQLEQSFLYYIGMNGNNSKFENRASGAYIFRPNGTEAIPLTSGKISSTIVEGKVATEVHQEFSSYVSQVIRVDPSSKFIDFDYIVGPINVDDKVGKEVIARFKSNLINHKTFFTDSYGRQNIKRIIDFRETWNYTVNEPVSGNYYPVNSRIFIQDVESRMQMSVLTDRSQGGSSLKEGTIELMLHRRLLHDDAFGVSEPLNEPGFNKTGLVVRGRYRLLIESIQESASLVRQQSITEYLQPQLAFTTFDNIQDHMKNYVTESSGLRNTLPRNVHLLTLEQWSSKRLLIRLEHFYSTSDETNDTELTKPAVVSLKELFEGFTVEYAEEMTLSGNQVQSQAKRFQWKTNDSDEMSSTILPSSLNMQDLTIELKPMEIRTLLLTIKRSS